VGTPVRDSQGRVVGLLGLVRDITERKANEDALKESELRFRSFVENAHDIIYALSSEGIFTYVSPNWSELMGEPAEVAIGQSFEPYVHPEDVHICKGYLRKILTAEGKKSSVEYRVIHRDGTIRWHVSIGSAMPSAAGEIIEYVGIARDVTDRKKYEEALRLSEMRYKSLAENFPDGALFLLDKDWRCLAANGKAFERAGLNSRDVIGKTVKEVFPELWDVLEPHMVRAFRGERVFFEVECGGRLYSNQAVLVDIERGKPEQVIIITQDITEKVKYEEEKAELEKQYQQVQKVESIGRLAGGVAHDLNNLLSPILGYSEILRGDFDAEDRRREAVDEIMSAGLRARDLVQQLLAFSRKQILEFKAVNLNSILTGLEKLLRRTIRENIEMVFELSFNAQMVLADVGQIEQVIMNLTVNAADAMPEGGRLMIETSRVYLDQAYTMHHKSSKPGEYALLAVSDTGFGMDRATREQIFEPFFSTKGEQGTGLGLSTVYGIVKQHGGNIWVYSEPEKGTTFKVYLPLAESPEVDEAVRVESMPTQAGSETILVVEDNEQVLLLTTSILKRIGYEVLAAQDGLEAIDLLTNLDSSVHLLLTDVVLPGMNGKEIFEKSEKIFNDLKVIYMSGYTDNVIAHHGVLDKGVHFIQKPFTVHGLAIKVREVLDGE
jgi:PAS domain S-box-containing protein